MARIYLPGEVWSYQTRDNEPFSRVFILKVDRQTNGEEIFHVAIDNLAIRAPEMPGGLISEIGHLPLSRTCLDESLTERVAYVGELPDISQGYALWHAAFVRGEASVIDIPIADIVRTTEYAVLTSGDSDDGPLP